MVKRPSVSVLGYKVYATIRNSKDRNAAKAEALSQVKNSTVLDVSLTDETSVKKAFDCVIAKDGKIDVLINNSEIAMTRVAESYIISDVQVSVTNSKKIEVPILQEP